MTAPATTRPAAVDRVNSRVLGAMLLVFGSGWLFQQVGIIDLPWTAIVSLVLFTLGIGMIMTSRRRARTVPLVLVGVALTLGLAVGTSGIDIKGGVGQRTVTPPALSVKNTYRLGIGELVLDLRHVRFDPHNTRVSATVGVGHLVVRVPAGVAVKAAVRTNLGNAAVFGQNSDVHGQGQHTYVDADYDNAPHQVDLDLRVGVGQIDVIRVSS
jgi:cell wall-active antibiotic response 4TMS protein YvqF